jgi:hypothetical protein
MRLALVLALPISVILAGCSDSEVPHTTPTGCQTDSACSDANPCTFDICRAGVCSNDPAPVGVTCGSGAGSDKCAGGDACDGAGECKPSGPVVVDDGNACTVDACDPATGEAAHTKTPGCVAWEPTPSEGAPSPRLRHTAVWTGSKMIIWGGTVEGSPPVTNTGGAYDPAAKVWTPTSTKGAPAPRHSHSAVWTGSKMIVWGGFGATEYEVGGGIYDPATDTWTAMTTTNAPQGRARHAETWIGDKMFVWGGINATTPLASGGTYDPVANTWKALPSVGAFSPRQGHSAVWTGDRVIVWGGGNTADWLEDGLAYKYQTGAWEPVSPKGAPSYREGHTAVWTGTWMVLWGGWNGGYTQDTGGIYDPASDTWTATSTTGAPSPRDEHTGIWTGSALVVWGGCGGDVCVDQYGDGGIYTPAVPVGGSWEPIAASTVLEARRGHTAAWTGAEMIVWGGRIGTKPTGTGAQAPILP